ncbi:hypothetical protein ACQP00_35570 [Dactylosporangium sp. CS-047395]|uniref:hypothetical protein n=1 Tax=Dactylosporangium sp. CS-047395 TaxID=3239936 RepID=UPI003D923685
MNLPTERDLPAATATRMRADLVAATRPSLPAPYRLRWALAVAAAVVLVLVLPAFIWGGRGHGPAVIAMGPDEPLPQLRKATAACLDWNRNHYQPLPVDPPDLAVAGSDGQVGFLLYINHTGYLACTIDHIDDPGRGGGFDTEGWIDPTTVPGPVQTLLGSASEDFGGTVALAGRVSDRVVKLVLEHGDGHATTARIEHGAFGLIADGVRGNAELVAYDAAGAEIYRAPRLAPRPDRKEECRPVPPAPSCAKPEPWAGRN